MRFSIVTKILACTVLIRLDLALGAGSFQVAREILAAVGLPPFNQELLGSLTLFSLPAPQTLPMIILRRGVPVPNLTRWVHNA
jgi:hypothetical protein